MLKYIPGLILCLVVLIGVAYVPPTYAASAIVVITQIQAGGLTSALEEKIVLYNNSSEAVDISDWCLKNKSNVSFACFSHQNTQAVYLPAHSFATVASYPQASINMFSQFSILYTPGNQSSGSIVGGSDAITLIDETGVAIDSHNWTTSLVGGKLFVRQLSPTLPIEYLDTDQASDWNIEFPSFIPGSQIQVTETEADVDVCPNIDGRQTIVPNGFEMGADGYCRERLQMLKLTEILPNAEGSDAGQEFIEIYNPNDQDVTLSSRYTLVVGPTLDESFWFPTGTIILAHSYVSFSNAQIDFSLLNSSSRVQLRGDDEVLDEVPSYQDPPEATAWALIDGEWQYTSQLTPGLENLVTDELADTISNDTKTSADSSELKPCNENQYRSPETNRCRNIMSASPTTQTPCKDGQYRSEETNRCRNIATTDDGPAPCKEGQERNPDTNRCRNVKAMPIADYGVLGAETSSGGSNWYVWFVIGGILLLALAYTVWEWRDEIGKLFQRLRGFVRIRK